MRAMFYAWVAAIGVALAGLPAQAEVKFRDIPTQFIAALGGPDDTSGTNADQWGLWEKDPGPRGVWLQLFPALATAGYAPAGWKFDPAEWWMEEHGLIMEKPTFPLAPGQYVVTGGREVTTILTIGVPDANGAQSWALADGATLGQVTHLACRSAVYSADASGASCSPAEARTDGFPVSPGAAMPAVANCAKRDYAVLFLIGMAEGS
jgi:hypothetical protein